MVVLTSFTHPTDGIRHRQQNTVVYVNDNNLGKGTLYIAESRLSWIGETGNGFSIEYPHIALHAISRDLSAFPQECLFLMLDTPLLDEDQNNEEEEDTEGDDSNKQGTTEMRLVPDDRGMLDAMFHAMNACQALHPDPEDSFSDEDFFEDADDEIPMEEADSQMARLRIGNMDGRAHIGDMMEDMVEGRVVGRVGGMALDRMGISGGMGVGNVGDMEEGTGEDTGEDTRESTALGSVGGMGEGRVVGTALGRAGISGGMVADMGAGISGGMVADMGAGISGGMVADMGAGISEGMVADMGAGISGSRVYISGGRVAGMVGGMEAGMEEGMEEGMKEGISAYTEDRMIPGDRPFFLGSTSHQNRTVGFPLAQTPHTVLDSNFDDAEN